MKHKSAVFLLLAAALGFCPAAIHASAAEQIRGGVKLTVSADRSDYDADAQIAVGIRLENNSGGDITDVNIRSLIPAAYRLADGSDGGLRATYIPAGNAISGELILIPVSSGTEPAGTQETAAAPETSAAASSETLPETVQTQPETGTVSGTSQKSGGLRILLPAAAAAGLTAAAAAVIIRKRKGRQLVILICAAAVSAACPAERAFAESETESFSVTETVSVAGEPVALTAEVSYTAEAEDMQAAVEAYYEDQSEEIIAVEELAETSDVFSEKEAIRFMAERGFTDYPLTYDFNMDGSYADEAEASPDSDAKHPMYQTYFVSADQAIWSVFLVGKTIAANPASYNLQSDLDAQVLISETDTLTSYTEMGNKLYTTIPKDSAVLLKTVDQINSKKLNELTFEEVITP